MYRFLGTTIDLINGFSRILFVTSPPPYRFSFQIEEMLYNMIRRALAPIRRRLNNLLRRFNEFVVRFDAAMEKIRLMKDRICCLETAVRRLEARNDLEAGVGARG